MTFPAHWTEMDKALSALDAAEQALVVEYGAAPSALAMEVLRQHRLLVEVLRRQMATHLRDGVSSP